MKITIESKPEGAELTRIKCDGKEWLHDGKTGWKRQSPILFPIVGRLQNDKTIIKGNTYEMTQHGFARDSIFEVIEYTENVQSYLLVSNEETKKKYPYDFILTVTYYTEENGVVTEYRVMNNGDEVMPFGIGGHPAYKIDYTKCYIEFEKEENEVTKYELEDGLIARGKSEKFGKTLLLKEDSFANDAIILKGLSSNKLWVKEKKTDNVLLEFNFAGFPYLALWSKPEATFLCIEPWYSISDGKCGNGLFAEKEGAILLQKGEEFCCSYCVKFY